LELGSVDWRLRSACLVKGEQFVSKTTFARTRKILDLPSLLDIFITLPTGGEETHAYEYPYHGELRSNYSISNYDLASR
jgi:hypothetical protein